MAYEIRVGHKISGQLATQALSRNLDSRAAGKSFSGRLSGRAFRALKNDPEIAKHLSGIRKGFKSEVPEEIVHRAQEKLAQEKLVKYGVRKDSYKFKQDLSKDIRKAESMSGHDKKDALKFLKLGEEEYQTQVKAGKVSEMDPAKIKKEIRKGQLQKALYNKIGMKGRAATIENYLIGLKEKLPEKEQRVYNRHRLDETLSETATPQSNTENKNINKTNIPPSQPPIVDILQ